jgi:DNA-directed RNA polymerase specialized sigma24 family protein
VGKQAEDQVKLLGSLLKSARKKSALTKGESPMDDREMVTRLSGLGWSVEEIAKATKLSRGEVELILEVAPKLDRRGR